MIFSQTRLLVRAAKALRDQEQIIEYLEEEKTATELAYMRIGRDLIEQFLIALDTPENHDEIRPRLMQALGFYRDEIAVREEHA